MKRERGTQCSAPVIHAMKLFSTSMIVIRLRQKKLVRHNEMPKKGNKMEHKVSRALQLNSISVLFLPTKLETIFTLLQIVQEEETMINISCIECILSDWAT